ncbi:hypothetical protein D8Y23_13975 [Microbacterium enclense]|uniref:Uncharacterized protein n=1 Tax=Microbacterium enclense TaxID=993073 RepID=A0A3S3L5H8_9MICO|nr:hypothetical protein [Microbacterium enclense]RWR16240.1 hypothetical protein D8Y23_13975 [Microbacterium enclense]
MSIQETELVIVGSGSSGYTAAQDAQHFLAALDAPVMAAEEVLDRAVRRAGARTPIPLKPR